MKPCYETYETNIATDTRSSIEKATDIVLHIQNVTLTITGRVRLRHQRATSVQ